LRAIGAKYRHLWPAMMMSALPGYPRRVWERETGGTRGAQPGKRETPGDADPEQIAGPPGRLPRVPLEQVPGGYRAMARREALKVLIQS
jgi:hypothetical protein